MKYRMAQYFYHMGYLSKQYNTKYLVKYHMVYLLEYYLKNWNHMDHLLTYNLINLIQYNAKYLIKYVMNI